MADREEVRMLLAQLSAKERGVLAARFGLESADGVGGTAEAGVSRYRMGQIEKLAIAKLRRAAAAGN
jgi:DNA-directed RNA polymerase sigma subunit (sigma70/sigma32)